MVKLICSQITISISSNLFWDEIQSTEASKKPRIACDFSKCVICQKHRKETLKRASSQGLLTFLKVLNIRKDRGFYNQYEKLKLIISEDEHEQLILTNDSQEFLWHNNCYSSFTSTTNLVSTQHSRSTSGVLSCFRLTKKESI